MIQCVDIRFAYPNGRFSLEVLDLEIASGEAVALIGPSGCGKTTLLNLLSGILVPDSGQIVVEGTVLTELSTEERRDFRLQRMGLAPQNFELLDYLTVEENLLLPFWLRKGRGPGRAVRDRAHFLAEASGLGNRIESYPDQLSQGERQRVCLCRALIAEPQLLLADEPTGNLDTANQERVIALLFDEIRRLGATAVVITHESELLPLFDRVIDIRDLGEGKSV